MASTAPQLKYENNRIRVIAIIREEAMDGGIAYPTIVLDDGSIEMREGDHAARLSGADTRTILISIKSQWFESSDSDSEMGLRAAIRAAVKKITFAETGKQTAPRI